jgi:hypothetical protein
MRLRPPRQPGAVPGMRFCRKIRNRVKRVFRHLFTLCSAASLVLCVAVCVVWVRSYRVLERVVYATQRVEEGEERTVIYDRYWQLVSGAGAVAYADTTGVRSWDHLWPLIARRKPRFQPGLTYQADPNPRHPIPTGTRSLVWRAGFRAHNPRMGAGDGAGHVAQDAYAVPYWFLASVTAVIPAASVHSWYGRIRVRRRIRAGLCPRCGYDLRASPERCPECGMTCS